MSTYNSNSNYTRDLPLRLDFRSGDTLFSEDRKQYLIQDLIGKGGFGSVYKVFDRATHQVYALKLLEFFRLKPSEINNFLLRFKQGYKVGLINSEYIVKNYSNGYISNNPYVLMDYCINGNLSSSTLRGSNLSIKKQIIAQICTGLNDLHQNGFVHRDLKPENVLLDSNNKVKLCDFDLSGRYGLKDSRLTIINDNGEVNEVWGTVAYAAPEQMSHKDSYKFVGPQVDIFSLGVTIYEFISGGHLPFGTQKELSSDPITYSKRKTKKSYRPITDFLPNISKNWIDFFSKSLEPNPTKRLYYVDDVFRLLEIDAPKNYILQSNLRVQNILTIKAGENVGHSFELNNIFNSIQNDLVLIGRHDSIDQNHISLVERSTSFVSRKHSTIERVNDRLFVRDGQWDRLSCKWVNSLNGTYINGVKISNDESILLNQGDILTFGEFSLQYN